MTDKKIFSFCVGRPWGKDENPDDETVCTYTYRQTVFMGTHAEAKSIAKAISEQKGLKYHVYKLVKI